MTEESIENITKLDSNFALTFVDHHLLPDMNFNEQCLIKSNISMPEKVINLFISYTLDPQLKNLNTDFTLGNCLFGSEKLTKNADPDKYKYTGYGIGFASRSEFLFADGTYGKKMSLFLELMWAHLYMLIKREKKQNILLMLHRKKICIKPTL